MYATIQRRGAGHRTTQLRSILSQNFLDIETYGDGENERDKEEGPRKRKKLLKTTDSSFE